MDQNFTESDEGCDMFETKGIFNEDLLIERDKMKETRMKCVKYLLFFMNLIFTVSIETGEALDKQFQAKHLLQ